ncbi:MAG: hypothetical protein WBP22_01540 [Candidatus Saccharimonas sp.]
MSHVPTPKWLKRFLTPAYDQVILPCHAGTWQLGGLEHAYWPVDEPYPGAIEFTYQGATYQIMDDLAEGQDTIAVYILRDSLQNYILALLGKKMGVIYTYREDRWKLASSQCV